MVVARDGLTVVTTKERAADLKKLLEALPPWPCGSAVTRLYLYDDARAQTSSRSRSPVRSARCARRSRSCARAGSARSIRRPPGFVGAEHLRDFDEAGAPRAAGDMRARVDVANSRCLVPLGWRAHDVDVWTCEGAIAAVRLARRERCAELARWRAPLESLRASGTRVEEIPGDGWSTCGARDATRDAAARRHRCARTASRRAPLPAGAIVIGGGGVYVEAERTSSRRSCST